jgi:hypothetical protein
VKGARTLLTGSATQFMVIWLQGLRSRVQPLSSWLFGFRPLDRTSWWWKREEDEAVHLMVDRKQSVRKGQGTRPRLQMHTPSDLLPPARSHFLEFLEPSKIALPSGDHVFKSWAFFWRGGTLCIQTRTLPLGATVTHIWGREYLA